MISLADARDADTPAIGPKAANLARLLHAGFPVPPGFVVPVSAYQAQRRRCGEVSVDALRSMAAAERRIALERRSRAFIEAELASGVYEQLQRHYAPFAAVPVAVRSSATVEDLWCASSAGIYESVLGVSSFAECLAAVKHCWASYWTERAFLYREAQGMRHDQGGMAVLVQRLVLADAAGVVFTRSPLGSNNRLLIEGSFGLGEAVVSSRVVPDRFLLDRQDLRLLERTIAPKSVRLTVRNGAVVEEAVPAEQQMRPCIDDAVLHRLAALSLDVEKRLGAAQDIEWVTTGGEIFLLQARPITSVAADAGKIQVWSNLNAGEVLPLPVSPMAYSLLTPCVQRSLLLVLGRLGMEVGDVDLTAQIAGRAYFNVNLLYGILRRLPRIFRINLNDLLGGGEDQSLPFRVEDLDIQTPSHVRFRWTRMILGFPGLALWFLFLAMRASEQAARQTNAQAAELQSLTLDGMPPAELAERIRTAAAVVLGCAEGLSTSLVAMRYFEALAWVGRRWFPGDPALASKLVAAGGAVDSAEAALALWRLAEAAHGFPAVKEILLAETDFDTAKRRLREAAGGGEFLAQWEGYLSLHGHHAVGELDVFTPRWSENPTALLGHVRGYLKNIGRVHPLETHALRTREARQLAEECRRKLNPLQQIVFLFLLRSACRGAMVRENMKSALIRLLAAMRRLLLEQGNRLAAAGFLSGPGGIFFMSQEELAQLLSGRAPEGLPGLVIQRRAEYEQNLSLSPPPVIAGTFDPSRYRRTAMAENAGLSGTGMVFHGLAVSPGTATGPARVISGGEESGQVQPGEILVAPYADPGWVPQFLQAAAIVVDLGGLLSHGSIIARELGIPAVANVAAASRNIRTGQIIEVDGNLGHVRIVG